MRYSSAHAAKSGSVPFMLRGPKSLRTVLSAAVAGAIAFAPAMLISAPAQAAALTGFSFADAIVTGDEGDKFSFEVIRTADASALGAKTLTWAITTGSGLTDAKAGDDYTVASGSLPFPSDSTAPYGGDSLVIDVNSLQDTIDESTETFNVVVSFGGDTLTAEGRITDDDDAPGYSLSVNDPSPEEANSSITVTAELDQKSGKNITIPLSMIAGTAKAGQDYTASTPTISIAADSLTGTATVAILEDTLYEEAEQTFSVKGGTSTTVSGTPSTTVTIMDDEEQPSIEISPDTAVEGSTLAFDVSLSGPSERAVTAGWATADGSGSDLDATVAATHGTATAGSDYTAGSGTVTFPATTSNTPVVGNTAQTVSVKSSFDSTDEASPEDLHVTLTSPTIAVLGDDTVATGGITDDDTGPVGTLSPVSAITEGSSGTKSQTFTVKLAKPSGQKVEVEYDVSTGGGDATAVQDFKATSGTLTFAAGETSKTFSVDIVGDTTYEGNETFDIDLSSSTASVTANTSITIKDDDAKPTYTAASMSMQEGDTGSVVVFPVKLSNPADEDVVFTVTDTPGTAKETTGGNPGDFDYIAPSSALTIPAGQTTGYVYFLVNGDDIYESNEQMKITLTPAGGAPLLSTAAKDASLTLANDDDAPVLTIVPASGNEGDKVAVSGVVTGMAQEDTQLNITFAGGSVNGSAAAATADFTNPGTVPVTIDGATFSGSPVAISTIDLTDDTTAEPAETIVVSGSGFGSGTVTSGTLTIAASDGGTTPTDPTAEAPTLKASSSYRLGAGSVTLSGKAANGATVDLWGRTVNSDDDAYEKITSTTASGTGAFSFMPELSTDGMYYKVMAGELASSPVRVYVKEDPELAATSPSKGVVRLVVTGDPKVRGLGARVFRQNSNGTFTLVGSGILNADGTFTKTLTGQASGKSYTYKSYVVGNAERGVLTNWSSYTKTVRVK